MLRWPDLSVDRESYTTRGDVTNIHVEQGVET